MMIRVHKIIYNTSAEGFGKRCCIWVQGCGRHCEGCMAYDTWDPCAGTKMDTEEILCRIFREDGIEGITLLGGEPFEQAEALGEIATKAKEKNLSVMAFTGFTYEELQVSELAGVNQLLAQVDLLIDGPYKKELRSFDRPWIGSSNQRYLFLTDRYSEKDLELCRNRIEVRVSKNGSIQLNGMLDYMDL